MVFNENGVIVNEMYSLSYLDEMLNEDFHDFTRKVLKTAVEIARKIIDAVHMAIEYASRIPYSKIIKEIKNNKTLFICDGNIGLQSIFDSLETDLKDRDYTKYIYAKGYGKWLDNFNAACDAIKSNNNITKDEIINILYGDSGKSGLWFRNEVTTGVSLADAYEDLVKIASELSTYTNPLRKAYSSLKVINASLEKGSRISVEVMAEMQEYCMNAISAYRNLSKMLLLVNKIHRAPSSVTNPDEEKYTQRSESIKNKYSSRYVKNRVVDAKFSEV